MTPEQTALIEEHLRLPEWIARANRRRLPHVEFEELISVGREGLVEAAQKYNGKSSFRGFAERVILRRLVDRVREDYGRKGDRISGKGRKTYIAKGKEPAISLEAHQENMTAVVTGGDYTAKPLRFDPTEEVDDHVAWSEALDCLSNERQRQVCFLYYALGWRIKEISKHYGVSHAMILKILSRAHERIKTELDLVA